LVAVVVASTLSAALSEESASHFKQMRYFLLGALPVVLVILLFKIQFSPGNDLFVDQGSHSALSRLTDLGRHAVVLKQFLWMTPKFGAWPWFSMPVVLFFYLLVFGVRADLEPKSELVFPLTVLATMAAGYYLIYIITPYDLEWHLQTSLNRLLMHLWPSALFVYFMIVRAPEEVFAANNNPLAREEAANLPEKRARADWGPRLVGRERRGA
jgi:hypothetical protein